MASLGDLVALARAEPGKLDWAGVTGAHEFVFAGWLKQLGLSMIEVPYRNPVDAANDLAENRVQVLFVSARDRAAAAPGRQDQASRHGQHRACAERTEYPDGRGSGLSRRLPSTDWSVCSVRRECRLELRERITADIRAVADSTVADRLAITGQIMNIGGPEEFAKSIDAQRATVAAFAQDTRHQTDAMRPLLSGPPLI